MNPLRQHARFDPLKLSWAMDKDSLGFMLADIATATEVTFDLETTGLDEHAVTGGLSNGGVAARVVLASFTVPQHGERPWEARTWVLPLSHPDSPFRGKWRKVFRLAAQEMRRKALIGHNIKFDLRWTFAHTGLDLSEWVDWDTQISSHLLNETSRTALKERVPMIFDVERWDDHDLSYPGAAEDVPLFDLGTYAARDTYWTQVLSVYHRDLLYQLPGESYVPPSDPEEQELATLGDLARTVAMSTVRGLTRIEQAGIGLDEQWAQRELAERERDAHDLLIDLRDYVPPEVIEETPELEIDLTSFAPTSKYFRAWANYAVACGDLRVLEQTPRGAARWNKAVLQTLAMEEDPDGAQLATRLLDYRDAAKKAEFLHSWIEKVTPRHTIHTTYNAGKVVTGRLSSNAPNMQQVTSKLKPAFIPRPGYYIVDLDYSQIELRVAAFVSRCQTMIDAFQRGDDLHRLLGARLTGKSPPDVQPTERQAAKSANFGLLYGMSPGGFQRYASAAYGVTFTIEEAEATHAAFYETWDGIGAWHARCVQHARRYGQITSPIGRVRRLPDIYSANTELQGNAERQAINSPVQGFASDLMQTAAASILGVLPGHEAVPGVRIVGTVHDSIVAEVPISEWKDATRACQERMVTIDDVFRERLHCDIDVPLAAEASVGTRWGLSDIGELS